ncbi:MAG: hypothetical protein WA441_13375 [Methyloceanibacter sp.]
MPARKTPSKGGKPDKLMRHAILLALNETAVVQGKRSKKYRLVANALVNKGMEGDIPAIKEINDRSDGKIPTLNDFDDGGLKLEDLIHMSYQVGKQRG